MNKTTQIAVGMKTIETNEIYRQVFDIENLNLKLAEGFRVVSHYGDFVLLEKQENKNE